MGTPTNLQNVDERGYTFVTEAADCQIVARALTVDDTLTPFPQQNNIPTNLPARRRIYVKNNNAAAGNVVFIGGADVTDTQGYPLAGQESVALDVTDDIQLYAVTAATEMADLRTLELA